VPSFRPVSTCCSSLPICLRAFAERSANLRPLRSWLRTRRSSCPHRFQLFLALAPRFGEDFVALGVDPIQPLLQLIALAFTFLQRQPRRRFLGGDPLADIVNRVEQRGGACAAGAEEGEGIVEDRLVQPEAAGDRHGVGAAGQADRHLVRRREGVDVEQERRIRRTRRLAGVHLQLRIVRCDEGRRALIAQIVDDGLGNRRPFGRVGAGAKLVKETSDRSSTCCRMRVILVMCDEKVERLCSIDCSSPISAKTLSKTVRRASTPVSGDQTGPLAPSNQRSSS
jgi:hypothetical protein